MRRLRGIRTAIPGVAGTRTGNGRRGRRKAAADRRVAAFLAALVPAIAVFSGDLGAETAFGGSLEAEAVFNIPGDRGYDETPLNAGNAWGVTDLTFRSTADLKLDARGETGSLELRLGVKQFPAADLLTGAALVAGAGSGGDPTAIAAGAADMFTMTDAYVYTLDVMRANVGWMPADSVRITLGRQSFLTGYGYGWNPVDLVNPPKDPTDPDAEVRGVDALAVRLSPASWLDAKFYGALPSDSLSADYEDLLAGTEITFTVSSAEFKLAGLWGGRESSADDYDAYPHAGAAGFFVDVFGVGLYGEGAVRSRSRRNDPDAGGAASDVRSGPVFSVLAGAEYYFAAGPALAVEYFYNGEGWGSGAREDFTAALTGGLAGGGGAGEYASLYTPLYFARHYILVNLTAPWYARETTFNLNVVVSPDSGAIILTPSAEINLNYEGTLVASIVYSGLFDLDSSERNEAYLAPVGHSASAGISYYF